MEIIKNGDLSKLRENKHFICERCGCEFIADDTEYTYPSQIEMMHDGIEAKCTCPTCGNMVYKHYNRRR